MLQKSGLANTHTALSFTNKAYERIKYFFIIDSLQVFISSEQLNPFVKFQTMFYDWRVNHSHFEFFVEFGMIVEISIKEQLVLLYLSHLVSKFEVSNFACEIAFNLTVSNYKLYSEQILFKFWSNVISLCILGSPISDQVKYNGDERCWLEEMPIFLNDVED